MPIPLMTVSVPQDDRDRKNFEPSQYQGLNYDMLSGLLPSTGASNKAIKVSNSDASFLFAFWKNSDISKDGDIHACAESFNGNDILRLKALGFVSGDEALKFTSRGKEVIKTIVLNEENNFLADRIDKPYTEILAKMDQNKKQRVRLALGR